MTIDGQIRLSRRTMLVGSMALVAGVAGAVGSCRSDPPAPDAWPRFDDTAAVQRLGEAALDVDASLAAVGSEIRTAAGGDERIGRSVLAERADDVAANDFVEVDGWILPVSLAGLAADAAARSVGGRTG